jgi:hypothetical protein
VAARSPPLSEPRNKKFFLLCEGSHNRKAWLFSDTPAGAHSSAVIYSLLETAKANGLDLRFLRVAL